MKQKQLTVSIILPTFNREKLLPRAIDSVIKQTYLHWELIIVDDGSTDKTFALVKSYIKKTSKIKYIKKQINQGVSLARNIGISKAHGYFIAFIDSDDEYMPNHLEENVRYFLKNPSVDLIYSRPIVKGNPYLPDKDNLKKYIHVHECTSEGSFFGKRNVFKALNGFRNILYAEGPDFIERARKNFLVTKTNFMTYIYHREHKGTITSSINEL